MPDLPDPIDPDALYRVDLTRPTVIGGVKLPVRGRVSVRGDLLARLIAEEGADVVRSAQPE